MFFARVFAHPLARSLFVSRLFYLKRQFSDFIKINISEMYTWGEGHKRTFFQRSLVQTKVFIERFSIADSHS